MAASTPNQLAVAAACFAKSIPRGDQLGCALYLWNIMAGLNLTPEQLKVNSKCFTPPGGFPAGDQMGALLYLINAGGGSAGGGGATFGNYGGGGNAPNFTPASGTGQAVDTSNGALWAYYNGAWTEQI